MMTSLPNFATLAHDLSQQMGMQLDPAPGMLRLDLNGVPFMLAHDAEQWGEENVMIACDFGPAPQENRCAILETLLAVNRDLHGLSSPVFTMDPQSAHIVAMLALPLEALDAAQTMQLMMKYVAVAENWKQTHFLDPELM